MNKPRLSLAELTGRLVSSPALTAAELAVRARERAEFWRRENTQRAAEIQQAEEQLEKARLAWPQELERWQQEQQEWKARQERERQEWKRQISQRIAAIGKDSR